jgi:hypothetical protein
MATVRAVARAIISRNEGDAWGARTLLWCQDGPAADQVRACLHRPALTISGDGKTAHYECAGCAREHPKRSRPAVLCAADPAKSYAPSEAFVLCDCGSARLPCSAMREIGLLAAHPSVRGHRWFCRLCNRMVAAGAAEHDCTAACVSRFLMDGTALAGPAADADTANLLKQVIADFHFQLLQLDCPESRASPLQSHRVLQVLAS